MPAPASKCILMIDDDSDLLELLTLTLSRKGYRIITLLNGVDFIDVLTRENPDMVITDINMPYVTGNTFCKMLKINDSTREIPVLLLSGNNNVEGISKACGADGYLSKPISIARLLEDIRRYI